MKNFNNLYQPERVDVQEYNDKIEYIIMQKKQAVI